MMDSAKESNLLAGLISALGEAFVLTTADAMGPYAIDHRKRYAGKPLAVVRPANVEQVAAVVRLCAANRTAVVPQGGNTGLVGGATPDGSGTQVVISLSRLNRIRALDDLNNTITVEAGCVLANIQQAAEAADRLFPLSLASEGSCQLGGNLSSNAGGTAVLRYGNTRELTLGLEVVLPSGEIWNGLRGLRKDNTGYDLKHLFIGAEGTLGIITAAVLKLFPRPAGTATAIVAVTTPRKALQLLTMLQSRCGERLTAFELFSEMSLSLVIKHYAACRRPLAVPSPYYVLIELSDSRDQAAVSDMLEAALGDALGEDLVTDAALASSITQGREFWALRENISEAQAKEGPNIKHDVALPISAVADFVEQTDAALAVAFPGVRMVNFGHLGDGNLHYNVSPPVGTDARGFLESQAAVNRVVYDAVARFNGSISAEHGLGQLKRDIINDYKPAVELELMRSVKRALDPLGIMNPGKVI
jgi:FAD/FMN-containing dehydrogenase